MHITSVNLSDEEILYLMQDKRAQSSSMTGDCARIELLIQENKQSEATYQEKLNGYLNALKAKSVCPVCEAKIVPITQETVPHEPEKPNTLPS